MDIDSSTTKLGKAKGCLLPIEYNLVRVFEKIRNRDPSWSLENPPCMWSGFECNAEQQLIAFRWNEYYSLDGPLMWEFVPTTLQTISISCTLLSGSIPFEQLPPRLEDLSLYSNKLVGSIDLTRLPVTLFNLSVPCWYFFLS